MSQQQPWWQWQPTATVSRSVPPTAGGVAYDTRAMRRGKRGGGGRAAAAAAAAGGGYNMDHNMSHNPYSATDGGRAGKSKKKKKLRPVERFYGAILRMSVVDLLQSNDSRVRDRLYNNACVAADVPVLTTRLPPICGSASFLYSTRASLVVEECRCVLANGLQARYSSRGGAAEPHVGGAGKGASCSPPMHLRLVGVSPYCDGIQVTMEHFNQAPFSPKELHEMRPASCFEIAVDPSLLPQRQSPEDFMSFHYSSPPFNGQLETSVLAAIVPNKDVDFSQGPLTQMCLTVYRLAVIPFEHLIGQVFTVTALTTLIGEARQFEACVREPKVPFLPSLLGMKERTHLRFEYDDDEDDDHNEDEDDTGDAEFLKGSETVSNGDWDEKKEDVQTTGGSERVKTATGLARGEAEEAKCSTSAFFNLPTLNSTQSRAAEAFLDSPPSSVSLVQGPPGTGKTTFLVSLICKALLVKPAERITKKKKKKKAESAASERECRRILVTAPTNKAITVIAERLLAAMRQDVDIPFNIVMIGVEDKLVPDGSQGFSQGAVCSPTLRGIFVYTWLEHMLEQFYRLRGELQKQCVTPSVVLSVSKLCWKLGRSLPYQARKSGANNYASKLDYILRVHASDGDPSDEPKVADEAVGLIDGLVIALNSMRPTEVVDELLHTANVIFATLSTSGLSSMRFTLPVDDLFVDEAAAATEPELFIPFQLRPQRLLAVGDPMQLPATITSAYAIAMGLDRSLHERLMYECHRSHIMLDVQYRMKPDISAFPAKQFYEGKLHNGKNVESAGYNGDVSVLCNVPYMFLNVNGTESRIYSGSYANNEEALAVISVLQQIKDSWSSLPQQDGVRPWDSTDQVRVITFYQGQVSLIQRLLNEKGMGRILVATVDSSQGCEADIVLVSFVRSSERQGSARHTTGFLTDIRRLNVALTRARHQLICIGNAKGTLGTYGSETMKALVADAQNRKKIQSFRVPTTLSGFPE